MELRVGKLREIIASTIGEDLRAESFTIDKSLTWIKKIVNKKSKIQFFVDCYNYSPNKLEFRLLLNFWIFEVIEEMEKYYKFLNEPFNNKSPLFRFSEADFNPLTRDWDLKFRNAYTHIVTDINDTDTPIKECRDILQTEVIPLLPAFSVLEEFQEFVLLNYKDPSKSWLAKSGIIAMKLKGSKELKMIVDHFWTTERIAEMPKDNFFRRYIENVVSFSES